MYTNVKNAILSEKNFKIILMIYCQIAKSVVVSIHCSDWLKNLLSFSREIAGIRMDTLKERNYEISQNYRKKQDCC